MTKERNIVLFIASSLDGYIATEKHNLDWLFSAEGEGDNGYSKFYETVDTILLGRITYEWIMENVKNEFPYKGKECYVFSKEKRNDTEFVKFINSDIIEFIKTIKQKDGEKIWVVGGSELLSVFVNEKLIDEMIITIAPVLIGNGIPLFKKNNFETKLLLKNINRYNQLVELHYDVIK
jgi:dihydrofolate reductase